MQGQDGEAPPAYSILQAELITDFRLLGDGQKVAQGIDHHVANHEDAFPGATFFQEVPNGIFFRDKEIISEGVGQDAVDLFGHGAVKATESGLDVSYADTEFRGR